MSRRWPKASFILPVGTRLVPKRSRIQKHRTNLSPKKLYTAEDGLRITANEVQDGVRKVPPDAFARQPKQKCTATIPTIFQQKKVSGALTPLYLLCSGGTASSCRLYEASFRD